jgi:ABC-2 type transport system permease protein
MRKFIAFTKIVWQSTVTYRIESLIWFLLELIPLLIILSFWYSLLSTGRLSPSQFSQLALYYITTLVISRTTSIHFEDWVIDEIKDGRISTYLLKPFSYQIYLLANEVTWRFAGLVYLLPSLLIFVPILKDSPPIILQSINVFLFVFVIVVSFFQKFILGFIIGIAAFWFDQSKSLVHFKWMCEGIFGGAWLPLYLFPHWLQTVAGLTPFYSWNYFPIQLLFGKSSSAEIISGIILSVFWACLLYLLSKYLWHRALLKYSAVGN